MDNTLPSPDTPLTDASGTPEEPASKRNKDLHDEIQVCKQYRRKLVQNWSLNIDYRRGKPFSSQSDEDRIAVNIDWSLTKQKQAALFSQVPEIRVNHPPQTIDKEAASWVHAYEQRVNDVTVAAGIETAMDECLPDCINAAGIGVVLVSREAITTMKDVPLQDLSMFPPDIAAEIEASGIMPDGSPLEMTQVPDELDARYCITRISPADFLWPIDFTGSDFNNAPWVGRTGRMPWAEAQRRFNLTDEDKRKYTGGDNKNLLDRLNTDTEKDQAQSNDVQFDEIFYKVDKYDKEAKTFSNIHHLVFLGEKEKPIVDEPWKGQKLDEETGELVGALKYAIQVLTLSYISDEAIPPSDSAIGRPQVNELNKSRTHMMLQREHSRPFGWFDVNRVDPMVQMALMKGSWQHMIPVQGDGTNIIGAVARSHMPQENFIFDRVIKGDLSEEWQVGQGQVGTDIETKAEVNAVQGNMQTRIARERAKVGKLITNIAEVIGGLVAIYEDPTTFGEGFSPRISKTLAYSILADSTVLLDSQQRIKRLMDFINFTAKSGWLNVEPVLKEIASLSGLDPNLVIQAPQPKPPAEPNVSLRLTGTEDLLNPLALGFLIKSGQAPPPELIEQAKQLIQNAMTPPPGTIVPPPPVPQTDEEGNPVEGGGPPQPAIPVPVPISPQPQAHQLPTPPNPPPPAIGEANPQWGALDRINKRVVERE